MGNHLKYNGYFKYHDISKLVVTVQQTMKLLLVKKFLVFLICKPYNFYNIDDNITITIFWC